MGDASLCDQYGNLVALCIGTGCDHRRQHLDDFVLLQECLLYLPPVPCGKAGMLYSTEDIFRNAQYLYSTSDYDGDTNVYRWNYFYTPVQIGDQIVGVRIAVRDMISPPESQVYNWGIKKDTLLGDAGHMPNGSTSHGASSSVSNYILPDASGNVNREGANPESSVGAAERGFTGKES